MCPHSNFKGNNSIGRAFGAARTTSAPCRIIVNYRVQFGFRRDAFEETRHIPRIGQYDKQPVASDSRPGHTGDSKMLTGPDELDRVAPDSMPPPTGIPVPCYASIPLYVAFMAPARAVRSCKLGLGTSH